MPISSLRRVRLHDQWKALAEYIPLEYRSTQDRAMKVRIITAMDDILVRNVKHIPCSLISLEGGDEF